MIYSPFPILFFFFFQAEDGIRDLYVTGVQTCALPICFFQYDVSATEISVIANRWNLLNPFNGQMEFVDGKLYRSEERRVGKECRMRGKCFTYEKNNKLSLTT